MHTENADPRKSMARKKRKRNRGKNAFYYGRAQAKKRSSRKRTLERTRRQHKDGIPRWKDDCGIIDKRLFRELGRLDEPSGDILQAAAEHDYYRIKLFIAKGADVNQRNEEGMNAVCSLQVIHPVSKYWFEMGSM